MPLNPVVMVRKMSSTAGPDLNWPAGEIRGLDREAEIVLQPGSLFAVALAGLAMALPALGVLPHVLGASEHLLRRRRRPPNVQGRARRFLLEEGIGLCRIGAVDRQLVLDVLDDGETIRERQLVPGRHRRAAHAAW